MSNQDRGDKFIPIEEVPQITTESSMSGCVRFSDSDEEDSIRDIEMAVGMGYDIDEVDRMKDEMLVNGDFTQGLGGWVNSTHSVEEDSTDDGQSYWTYNSKAWGTIPNEENVIHTWSGEASELGKPLNINSVASTDEVYVGDPRIDDISVRRVGGGVPLVWADGRYAKSDVLDLLQAIRNVETSYREGGDIREYIDELISEVISEAYDPELVPVEQQLKDIKCLVKYRDLL